MGQSTGIRRHFSSVSSTSGEWYSRLARGMKLRTGVVRYHNDALTLKMVLGMDDVLEKEWQGSTLPEHWEVIEELMLFVLIGFGSGLQGDEIPSVSLKSLLHFWDETRADPDPFIMITLYGRFKGEAGHR